MAQYGGQKTGSFKQTRGANPSEEIVVFVLETDDINVAQATAIANVPEVIDFGFGELPLASAEAEEVGPNIFEVTCRWGAAQSNVIDPETQTVSFDTTGGRAKVTQSLSTQSYPSPGGVAPSFGGAIGVTKSGIEGAEVTTGALTFTIKKTLPAEVVSQETINRWADLTGHYNNSSFAGRAAGEVRFDGATGDQKAPGADVDVSFKFTVSPNMVNGTIAGITGINKLGWQYLWILYREQDDGNFLVQRAVAVYVEDLPLCRPKNFADIGIGS